MRDRRCEFGLGLAASDEPRSYGPFAQAIEARGFDAIQVYGDLLFEPPALVLGQMAAATSRIRLGLGCLNPFTLHPVEIAGQLAYLDRLSAGRTQLGLVRGAWLEQLGIDQRMTISAIRDTVQIVRRLLAGDRSGYAGPVFQLGEGLGFNFDVLRPEVPLAIGTWSPKLSAVAVEVDADEVAIGGTANPLVVKVMRERVGDSDTSPRITVNPVTVVDQDGARARAKAKADAAMYVEVVAKLDPTVEIDPELVRRLGELVAVGEHEAAGNLISDDVLSIFAIAGTVDEVTDHALRLYEAGVQRIDFGGPYGIDLETGLDLLQEVMKRCTSELGIDRAG